MHFEIDWASLINGSKFTVFSLFYFVFEDNFQVQAPRGAYICRGDLMEGFWHYEFGGLIFGGAYTWRSLFSEFYGISLTILWKPRLQAMRSNLIIYNVHVQSYCAIPNF